MESGLEIVRRIIARHDEYVGRFAVPGEGSERTFRTWLVLELLHMGMQWPPSHIIGGERHELLLVDDQLMPVITIETKDPDHEATQADWNAFQGRLPHYSTLRYAYITNGRIWDSLDLETRAGQIHVQKRAKLNITTTTQ